MDPAEHQTGANHDLKRVEMVQELISEGQGERGGWWGPGRRVSTRTQPQLVGDALLLDRSCSLRVAQRSRHRLWSTREPRLKDPEPTH